MKYKITWIFLLLFCCIFSVFAEELTINSKTVVAMDADTNMVLYGKDMEKQIYPASTTKILTAILAIENLDLNKSVIVSKEAISIPWDSSSIYLKEGEVLTIEELLYGMLLNSGNDAANVLAEAVSKDIPTFVDLMNEKAKEIGCTNTHFNNAHGYSDDEHYTTALDMAKIFSYCIKNETFVKIISTKSHIINETNKTNEKRYLSNTNRLIQTKEDSVYGRFYEYCIGGKTGYTDEAGRTLVTFGKKDNKSIVVTIFGASSSGNLDVRYTDAINLFEYSFNNFTKKTIAEPSNYTFDYINIDKELKYNVALKENVEILVRNDDNFNVTYTIDIHEENINDITEYNFKEIPAGTITFNLIKDDGNEEKFYQELYLIGIEKYSPITVEKVLDVFSIILIISLIIILLLIILIIQSKTKKVKKMYNTSRKERRKP